ncbi:sulfite exporter TauE/SafE family protein [Hahella sp. KA22]|uniref:sulfite exporter TauE/SafE family protein n=1 Tax=Hahella sp. KA22 TaxID=1628392 RepID=UPI000FDCEC87|nr:sulfite exporter TauE/SafE family protein [Hahella sp. KA22]AZZ90518.1 sulfite exporter TauE/SafE family protein [Hahella sp. KA22]QAY53888.1 sulfite exporter TauE/SafE family protein [Hahella sp. KA22]
MVFLAYLALGALAGVLAGLFGIGGGLIIVPALIFSFELQSVAPSVATHLAVGTSLATIIFTSINSIRAHHQKQGVNWRVFRPMAVGLMIGAVLGAQTASLMPAAQLKLVIGIFAITIGVQMALALKPKPHRSLPGDGVLVGVGGGIGWASAIFGIGGGSLSVPYLTWCNVRMQQAVGTSAACGLPIALMGAVTNIWEGWGEASLPEYSLGFIYLPALAGIAITSMPFASLGAKLAHRLPGDVLKRIFSVLLFIVGGRFLYQAWGQL